MSYLSIFCLSPSHFSVSGTGLLFFALWYSSREANANGECDVDPVNHVTGWDGIGWDGMR